MLFRFVFPEKLSVEAMFLHYQKQLIEWLYYLCLTQLYSVVLVALSKTQFYILLAHEEPLVRPHSKLNLDVL